MLLFILNCEAKIMKDKKIFLNNLNNEDVEDIILKKSIKIDYEKFEHLFQNLIEGKGLAIHDLDETVLFKLLNFIKNNYDCSCDFFNEVLKMYENNSSEIVKQALLKKINFFDIKAKKFFHQYKDFFACFNENEAQMFCKKIDYYIVFVFYILHALEKKESLESLEQIINNLKKIYKLDIDKIYLKFYSDTIGDFETAELYYQPEGIISDDYLSLIYYKEENVFSDVEPTDEYVLNKDSVDVFFQNPKFIIKNTKVKGFRNDYGGNFDKVKSEMVIYDLLFEGDLPSKRNLDTNTLCQLDAYKDLIYLKKCDLFESDMHGLKCLLEQLRKKLCSLRNLSDELEIKNALKESFDFNFCEYSEDDFVLMETALTDQIDNFMNERVRTLVKKR